MGSRALDEPHLPKKRRNEDLKKCHQRLLRDQRVTRARASLRLCNADFRLLAIDGLFWKHDRRKEKKNWLNDEKTM